MCAETEGPGTASGGTACAQQASARRWASGVRSVAQCMGSMCSSGGLKPGSMSTGACPQASPAFEAPPHGGLNVALLRADLSCCPCHRRSTRRTQRFHKASRRGGGAYPDADRRTGRCAHPQRPPSAAPASAWPLAGASLQAPLTLPLLAYAEPLQKATPEQLRALAVFC